MAGFDLGAMLASVSDSDTGREQIEYIPHGTPESPGTSGSMWF